MTRIFASSILLLVGSETALASNFWLSTSGSIPSGSTLGEVPRIYHYTGTTNQQIFFWGRPDPGETLRAFGFNVRSTDPNVVELTSLVLHNPLLGNTGAPFFKDIFRYEFPFNGTLSEDGSLIENFAGLNVANVDVVGVGLGPATESFDPLYDAVNDAWLMATLTYDVKELGHADIFLQISSIGIVNAGGHSSEQFVVFGDPSDPALNGEDDREVDSLTPDAIIWSIPEPSAFVLACVGLLGIVGWSRCKSMMSV